MYAVLELLGGGLSEKAETTASPGWYSMVGENSYVTMKMSIMAGVQKDIIDSS